MQSEQLTQIYEAMFERFGPQHWWPGQTQFEIMVGAILTQNTNWGNVEKAIGNLRVVDVLSPVRIRKLAPRELAEMIRPAGYYNIKAGRLKNFISWLFEKYDGDLSLLDAVATEELRRELLQVKGVGKETADSILLYALNRPIFVVDAYTARIACRHHLIEAEADYDRLQDLFQSNLPQEVQLFNEYHALLVRVGKEFCRPRPNCADCPLNHLPHTVET